MPVALLYQLYTSFSLSSPVKGKGKGKSVPLQAWSGTEGSRKLRFPHFMTTVQDGGKVFSLTHRSPLPQQIHLVLISVRGWVDPRAIVQPEGLSLKNSNNTIGNFNAHWLLYVPSGQTIINPTFCPKTAHLSPLWISERRSIISLYRINRSWTQCFLRGTN